VLTATMTDLGAMTKTAYKMKVHEKINQEHSFGDPWVETISGDDRGFFRIER
jgi:hypothetical protein